MGIREWAKQRMTKAAQAAFDRGDPVYVHQLTNVQPAAISQWIKNIESVGWQLQGEPQQTVAPWPAKGQMRWTLTFRRAA